MKTKPILEFNRGVRTGTDGMNWYSKCGRYMVHMADVCYGVKLNPVWYTAWAGGHGRLSRHRSKQAAMEACVRHARRK